MSQIIYGPVLAFLTLAIWINGIEFRVLIHDGQSLTQGMINANDRLVQSHVQAWGEAPESLNELRLFARQISKKYSSFDVWGERIEYLRLGKVNYTIRSFGLDGVQNRPGDQSDPGVFRWGPMVSKGLQYASGASDSGSRPSVVLFAGADDTANKWHARLFVDPVSGVRRLLVRSRTMQNFFMLAPHDGVEEFLWLPHQEKIIFTASQSVRYADGLYLWDLKSDESFNIFALSGDMSDLNPGTKQQGYYLALSSVQPTNPVTVSVFVQPIINYWLDPYRFFHPENLHRFHMGEKIVHVAPSPDSKKYSSMFDTGFLGTASIASGGDGNAIQRSWLKLPMGGDWEKAITGWQNFAVQHGKAQLTPYAVLGLTMFYRDAAKEAGNSSREGIVFNGFSRELGKSLSHMPVAPGFVRAIGAWMAQEN